LKWGKIQQVNRELKLQVNQIIRIFQNPSWREYDFGPNFRLEYLMENVHFMEEATILFVLCLF